MRTAWQRVLCGIVTAGLSLSPVPAFAQLSPAQLKARKDREARDAAAKARAERERSAEAARERAVAKAKEVQAEDERGARLEAQRRYWTRKGKSEPPELTLDPSLSQVHASTAGGIDGALSDARLSRVGVFPSRDIAYDFWHPQDEGEWRELGNLAILKISVSTDNQDELPLKSVYVIKDDIRIEFRREYSFVEPKDAVPRAKGFPLYYHETYFYVVPSSAIKNNSPIIADFAKNREGFRIGAAGYIPSFSMYSNDDGASFETLSRNFETFRKILAREYPEYAARIMNSPAK